MASKFLRRQRWWVKLRHPVTGESIRESLETGDPARAELLRQRLDLEVALLDPRFQAAKIPERLLGVLGLAAGGERAAAPAVSEGDDVAAGAGLDAGLIDFVRGGLL